MKSGDYHVERSSDSADESETHRVGPDCFEGFFRSGAEVLSGDGDLDVGVPGEEADEAFEASHHAA